MTHSGLLAEHTNTKGLIILTGYFLNML